MSYDAPNRPLVYPLKNPTVIETSTDDDVDCTPSSFVWPDDSDERTLVPFMLSLNEYNVLANTIDVGRDIAYGVDSIQVLWLWLRNMRCEVSICSMIIDCVMNDEDTKNAIINMLQSSDAFNDYISEKVEGLTTGQIVGKIIPGDCDNSVLAGRVIAIVERMNIYNEDALEIIEVGTNDEEKIAAVLDGIPSMSKLPVGDIIDFAQDFLEDFFENYSAAVTEEWKDSVAEDLYCLAKESVDCSLTFEQLFDYFQQRASSGLTIESVLLDVVGFAISGDFVGDEAIASGMYALQIAFMRVGQDYFGINLPKLGGLIRDALPSTRWEEWDDCATPEDCMDLTDVDNPWLALGGPSAGNGTKTASGLAPDLYIPDGNYYLTFQLQDELVGLKSSLTFKFNEPTTNMSFVYQVGGGTYTKTYDGAGVTEITFNDFEGAFAPNVSNEGSNVWTIKGSAAFGEVDSGAMRIEEFCYVNA